MKLAVTADWLPNRGGAEQVVETFLSMWPDAPVFTTVARKAKLGGLGKADIRTSPLLQFLFRMSGSHRWLLPLMPAAMEKIDLTGFDVILSSSHAVGKGIVPPSTAVHVCYCHTPMRYAWEMEEEYLKDFGIRWPLSKIVKGELKRLRRWDLSTAKRVDHFIANSSETQNRIQKFYGRESVVIPPPVDARFYEVRISPPPSGEGPGVGASYFLALGRLVPYKRFDLLVELANRLKLPLKIGGTGPDMQKLKALAGPTVEFLGFVSDTDLPALYAGATAFFSPQVEDAGIVPMEAQACGTPVIALGKGGVLDVVENGVTGVFASAQTVDAFEDAVKRFQSITFDRAAIREHARKFHSDVFREKIQEEIRRARQGVHSS